MRSMLYLTETKIKRKPNTCREKKKINNFPCDSAALGNYIADTKVCLGDALKEENRATCKLDNLTRLEREAIISLKEKKNIVIKKSD